MDGNYVLVKSRGTATLEGIDTFLQAKENAYINGETVSVTGTTNIFVKGETRIAGDTYIGDDEAGYDLDHTDLNVKNSVTIGGTLTLGFSVIDTNEEGVLFTNGKGEYLIPWTFDFTVSQNYKIEFDRNGLMIRNYDSERTLKISFEGGITCDPDTDSAPSFGLGFPQVQGTEVYWLGSSFVIKNKNDA
jgi:hypothetical protein